ncbi:MAG TPA: hypothetical protein VMU07_02030 [Candidatus Paceibacterota bacterium]|nr:hypothetical protein [Candidatus Paceibacterota bacterium]
MPRDTRRTPKKIFEKLEAPQPPADLVQKTLQRIMARERKILMAKLAGLGSLFAASLALVVTQMSAAAAQLAQSGFFQFGSLFFSDFGAAAANLPDFFLSLFESFPVFSAGLAIGGLAVAIWSFAGFVDDASILRATKHYSSA